MTPEMKWHIYNSTQEFPLCWDGKALDFSTKEQAELFLASCRKNSEHPESFYEGAVIVQNILFYDGGHMDGDNCIVEAHEETGEELLTLVID